jgi:hypothetical protein
LRYSGSELLCILHDRGFIGDSRAQVDVSRFAMGGGGGFVGSGMSFVAGDGVVVIMGGLVVNRGGLPVTPGRRLSGEPSFIDGFACATFRLDDVRCGDRSPVGQIGQASSEFVRAYSSAG